MSHDSKKMNAALVESATTAETVSSAAGMTRDHPLEGQIKVADRQAAIEAGRRGSSGLRFFRIQGGSP